MRPVDPMAADQTEREADQPPDPAVEVPYIGPNITRLGRYSHVYERSRFARAAGLHFPRIELPETAR